MHKSGFIAATTYEALWDFSRRLKQESLRLDSAGSPRAKKVLEVAQLVEEAMSCA
jgi:hypothetical protein